MLWLWTLLLESGLYLCNVLFSLSGIGLNLLGLVYTSLMSDQVGRLSSAFGGEFVHPRSHCAKADVKLDHQTGNLYKESVPQSAFELSLNVSIFLWIPLNIILLRFPNLHCMPPQVILAPHSCSTHPTFVLESLINYSLNVI